MMHFVRTASIMYDVIQGSMGGVVTPTPILVATPLAKCNVFHLNKWLLNDCAFYLNNIV